LNDLLFCAIGRAALFAGNESIGHDAGHAGSPAHISQNSGQLLVGALNLIILTKSISFSL
jgi:hypothetical protein